VDEIEMFDSFVTKSISVSIWQPPETAQPGSVINLKCIIAGFSVASVDKYFHGQQ